MKELVGKDLDLGPPPKIKVILVTDKIVELEAELQKGWKIAQVFQHAAGALFLLMK